MEKTQVMVQIPKRKVKRIGEWLLRETGASLQLVEGNYYQVLLSSLDGERLKVAGCRVLGAVAALEVDVYAEKPERGVVVNMLVEWDLDGGLVVRGMVDEIREGYALVVVVCLGVVMRQSVELSRLRPWVPAGWSAVWE